MTHLTLCARRSRATTACGAAVPAGEVKRRADVVLIFPNEDSITRLIGAVLLEQNDEWLLQCRYMQIEGMAELIPPSVESGAISASYPIRRSADSVSVTMVAAPNAATVTAPSKFDQV